MAAGAAGPSAGWFEGREHCLAVRVYYEDTDFTGLVYHANYARYFERGRSDFLRLAGVRHAELLAGEDPLAFTVTRLSIDFRAAARIDDALIVRTAYSEPRGVRLLIRQRIVRDAVLVCEAAVEVVCIGLNGRPKRPPQALVQALSPWFIAAP